MLPSDGDSTIALAPQHTWTGFQHLLVRVTGDAEFDGKIDSVAAQWGGAVLESTAEVGNCRTEAYFVVVPPAACS